MKRALSVVALALSGCTITQPPVTRGCSSLAECPHGKVCDLRVGQCVAEPTSGVIGSFSCRVYAADKKTTIFPGSELIGSVGGDRWSFPTGAICHRETDGTLSIEALPIAGPSEFYATLTAKSANSGGTIQMHPAVHHKDPGSATILNPDANVAYGYSVGGIVHLSRPANVGSTISGFVAIDLSPVAKVGAQVGAACPRGAGDCGRIVDAAYCVEVPFTSGQKTRVCAVACDTTADCSTFPGSVCTNQLCTTPCTTNADCAAGLLCAADPNNGPSGCL